MIRLAPGAVSDLERLRNFLYPENPKAAQRAMRAIWNKIELIARFPEMGVPAKAPDIRQTFVRFGKRSYVIRYAVGGDSLIVLRIWHSRERRD